MEWLLIISVSIVAYAFFKVISEINNHQTTK